MKIDIICNNDDEFTRLKKSVEDECLGLEFHCFSNLNHISEEKGFPGGKMVIVSESIYDTLKEDVLRLRHVMSGIHFFTESKDEDCEERIRFRSVGEREI